MVKAQYFTACTTTASVPCFRANKCCEILLWAYFTSGCLVLANQLNIPVADTPLDLRCLSYLTRVVLFKRDI